MNLLLELRRSLEENRPTAATLPPKPARGDTSRYAAWRLLHSWKSAPTFGPDQAVLLRQAVRWGAVGLPVNSLVTEAFHLHSADVNGISGFATAEPFIPHWLQEDTIFLETGMDHLPIDRQPQEQIAAESFLPYTNWKSQALKEACWRAIQAPPGSTTLIALPTGSGKSLCFQLLARFRAGLTLVIVPTVALAIDQCRSATATVPALNPLYYAANDPGSDPSQTIEMIESGKTRILFTSPEACVSGRLRYVIGKLATEGRLDHLVVDEAHIVASWGVFFRVDFQMLSIVCEGWRRQTHKQLRTYLLSATFTKDCRTSLQQLFGRETLWQEFISQRLRPELTYYISPFLKEEDQEIAVMDCLWHLPRPLILYTTEVADANEWKARLLNCGFLRVDSFTGETPPQQRRRLLDSWRQDDIDVMVATSAFGLGVDKQDVSAVVHACLPETLDRYYQEAGRAGRDGNSATCVLLPSHRDKYVATGMGPRLLGKAKLQQRWDALWRQADVLPADDIIARVPLNAKQSELVGTRTWSENVRWNKRLLLQLLRAGLLDLEDLEYVDRGDGEDPTEWARVKLHISPHSQALLSRLLEIRDRELATLQNGLDQMIGVVQAGGDICHRLRELYGPETQLTCGGCPGCRRRKRSVRKAPCLTFNHSAVTAPTVAVVANCPSPILARSEVIRLMRHAVAEQGTRRFLCAPEDLQMLLNLANEAFRPDTGVAYRIDAFGNSNALLVNSDEALIVLHVSRPLLTAFELRVGQRITHWVCRGAVQLPGGRSVLDQGGIVPFLSPEAWLATWGKI